MMNNNAAIKIMTIISTFSYLCLLLGFTASEVAAFQPSMRRAHLRSVASLYSSSDGSIPNSEISSLFRMLRDTTVLYDPSRGTCCRNKCSGCTYLDSNGNFAYDEFTTNNNDEVDGWIAPYVKVDFGEKIHTSTWSKLLFSANNELEKDGLSSILNTNDVSNEALQALWVTLSPSVGYPRLKSNEVIRAIKGIDGANSEMGGAVDYTSFRNAMLSASTSVPVVTVDYDALDKEQLLELCAERGMKTNFPKMKRIIIEELRFWDANGRQGKRHPTKNTLS
jgi:hypothetical protein